MIDFESAKANPEKFFTTPDEVVSHPELSNQQKIEILQSWEYDARELETATEENMSGDSPSMLGRVLNALQKLDSESTKQESPTKQ